LPREDYLTLNFSGGKVYVRRDRISQIGRADGIIFDCDGVLVDIRESYNKAISKSTAYILEGVTGCVVPESIVSNEIIYLFRKAGGFNNDWDTVYGILMFTLSSLPRNIRRCLEGLMGKVGNEDSPFKRLMLMKEYAERESRLRMLDDRFFVKTVRKIKGFAELLDSTGRRSVDKNLAETFGNDEDSQRFYNLLRLFLHPADDVRISIIARVFEEFFCGASLFKEIYRVPPQFNNGSGLIENGNLIIHPETLNSLALILGKRNLGIASGSRIKTAEYSLGDLIGKFNPRFLVFLEDVERAEREYSMREGRRICLRKPHPFSLLKAAERFRDSSLILYVGDSMEDAVMTSEAAKMRGGFLFAGVYRYTGFEDNIIRSFLDYGCDMIIPSVNELPTVLEDLRRRKEP